jgi:replicative DNA helicase
MSHPELELISNILETGDFQTVKKKGLTPEWFALESAKDAYSWLWTEFHDPQQRGEVPTVDRFLRKFPNFDFAPSRNSLNALIDDVRTQKMQGDIQLLLNEMQEEVLDGAEPSLILDTFLPKFRTMNVEAREEDGILLSSSIDLLRQQYDTHADAGGIVGVPYPWGVLNEKTGGMRDEEFVVIYGRSGNMKTWVACAIGAQAYLDNHRVMVYSKEISREAMLTRFCSILGAVDYDRLRRGKLTPDQRDDFFELMEDLVETEEEDQEGSHHRGLLFVSDKGKRGGSSVEDLIAAAERFRPDVIVVDGFYLMRDARSGPRTPKWQKISNISQDLKGMAQYLSCPVIGTTQANRANAKEPSADLDDLSFADGIGHDADIAFRCFLAQSNPTGRGASVLLVFSKSRETVIPPFIINGFPGGDFGVQQANANIKQFLDMRAKLDMQNSPAAGAATTEEKKKRKPRKRDGGFRS